MRRNSQTIGLGSSGARQLAGGVLGLAVLVALFGTDSDAAVDADRPGATASRAETAAPPRLVHRDNRLAQASAATGFDLADQGPANSDLPGPDQAGAANAPEDGSPAAAASPLKPDPDGMERLIAASRARSGGVDQGDEVVR